jgi:hypothetical protein
MIEKFKTILEIEPDLHFQTNSVTFQEDQTEYFIFDLHESESASRLKQTFVFLLLFLNYVPPLFCVGKVNSTFEFSNIYYEVSIFFFFLVND